LVCAPIVTSDKGIKYFKLANKPGDNMNNHFFLNKKQFDIKII